MRAIVLTGEGKGFCSGQSLDDPALTNEGGKLDIMRTVEARYNPLLRKMLSLEKPIVAAINGPVAGAAALPDKFEGNEAKAMNWPVVRLMLGCSLSALPGVVPFGVETSVVDGVHAVVVWPVQVSCT